MSAWPVNWRSDAQLNPSAPYRRTFRALVSRHGLERALAITEGRDEATNADLSKWRQLGSKAAAA